MPPALELHGVTKTFDATRASTRSVSPYRPGRPAGIIGPSGTTWAAVWFAGNVFRVGC